MSKITFADKQFLNQNANIPDINKCNDSDMNEIKQVVNENDDTLEEIANLGFAKMASNVAVDYITTEITITQWENSAISYGDIIAQPGNGRIKITNTSLIEIGGTISGNNYSSTSYYLVDENNTRVNPNAESATLVTISTYYGVSLKTLYMQLDNTKTYYLYLKTSGYDGNTFELNNGFGGGGTTLYAKKLK